MEVDTNITIQIETKTDSKKEGWSGSEGSLGGSSDGGDGSDGSDGSGSNKNETNKNTIPFSVFLATMKQYYKNKYYYGLFLYLFFLFMFCGIVREISSIHFAYEQNFAIKENILEDEFPYDFDVETGEWDSVPYYMDFNMIGTNGDLWNWIEGPFFSNVFGTLEYIENNEKLDNRDDYIGIWDPFYDNSIIGKIEFRQIRVMKKQCDLANYLELPRYNECFPTYSKDKINSEYFYPSIIFTGTSNYTIEETDSSIIHGYPGHFEEYDSRAFTIYLPLIESESRNISNYLKTNNWLSSSTRVFTITVTSFNKNTNLFSIIRVTNDYSFTGRMKTRYEINTFPLFPYNSTRGKIRLGFELLYCAILLYYGFIEVYEVYSSITISQYLQHPWNVLECFNIILYVYILFNYVSWVTSKTITQDTIEIVNNNLYLDLYDYGRQYKHILDLCAINIFLGFVKIFKYLQFSHHMTMLWDTILYAMWDILSMFTIFFIIIGGFSVLGLLVYGPYLLQFHNLTSSVSTLMRMILGEWDYRELSETNPYITPIFFMAYIFIVVFVILNMFIAVICEYYERIREHKQVEYSEALLPTFLETVTFKYKMWKSGQNVNMKLRKCKIKEEREVSLREKNVLKRDELKSESQNNDNKIEIERNNSSLSNILKKQTIKPTSLKPFKKLFIKVTEKTHNREMIIKLKIQNLLQKVDSNLKKRKKVGASLFYSFLYDKISPQLKTEHLTLGIVELEALFENKKYARDFLKLYFEINNC